MKKLNGNLENKNTIGDIMSSCRCFALCSCKSNPDNYEGSRQSYYRLSNTGSTTNGPEPY